MGGGSGAGGSGFWGFCPRCKRLGLMDGRCQFEDCDYPRWPLWAAFLFMAGVTALAIVVVVLFA